MTAYARDFVGYGKLTPRVEWPGRARIALSLVINFEEGSEQTPLYGDPRTDSMPEVADVPAGHRDMRRESFFDYGIKVGFWRLLELLDLHRVMATYSICGQAALNNPVAAAEITLHGHEPSAHGYRWRPRYQMSEEDERDDIRKAVEAIQQTTGQRPLGWNSREPSVHTGSLLVEEGGFFVRLRPRTPTICRTG